MSETELLQAMWDAFRRHELTGHTDSPMVAVLDVLHKAGYRRCAEGQRPTQWCSEAARLVEEKLRLEHQLTHDMPAIYWQLKTRAEKAEAERDALRAERDTMLLHTRDFVSWFNRHYQDPSYNLDHPWCVINARLDAYADALAAIDAARGES